MKYNLSEISAIIKDRRTIYPEDFSDRKIHKEVVEMIIGNATWAPNHGMTQPWRYKIFTGAGIEKFAKFQSDTYKKITASDKFDIGKFEKLQSRPKLAQVIIAICMERQKIEKIPEMEEIEAVACSVQNMYLTCTAYGIGAYWGTGGVTYTNEMKKFLGLGEKDKCLGFLYLGYPKGEWPKGHRKPIEYISEWIDE